MKYLSEIQRDYDNQEKPDYYDMRKPSQRDRMAFELGLEDDNDND